ncbi:MAG: DUF2933 domain-containing protein [Myxococcales bacterium]|nr:DUF2933 domain-containing protein [Myxococcales bacterium]
MKRSWLWVLTGVMVAAAVLLLWEDHDNHILAVLPFVILAACPIMHLFMHRNHGGGHGHGGHGDGTA